MMTERLDDSIERRSGEDRRASDGGIVETVKRVDSTLSVAQRWGGMIGTFLIVGFYGGMNWTQYHGLIDVVHDLQGDVKQIRLDRVTDGNRIHDLEAKFAQIEKERAQEREDRKADQIVIQNVNAWIKAIQLSGVGPKKKDGE